MNIADTSGRTFADARISSALAEPRRIQRSLWRSVRVECNQEPSDLSAVIFDHCQFNRTYFGNAKLSLEKACFEDCDLTDVTFMYGRLRGAIFRRSRLTDCLLRSADLRAARFEDCVVTSSDFSKADFSGAVFERTELIGMEQWGWHGFPGAQIADAQRYKYFIASDLRSTLAAVPVPAERLAIFMDALDRTGFGDGEAMYIYDEWKETILFEDFVTVGKTVTRIKG